jgi:hypothetical protein
MRHRFTADAYDAGVQRLLNGGNVFMRRRTRNPRRPVSVKEIKA